MLADDHLTVVRDDGDAPILLNQYINCCRLSADPEQHAVELARRRGLRR